MRVFKLFKSNCDGLIKEDMDETIKQPTMQEGDIEILEWNKVAQSKKMPQEAQLCIKKIIIVTRKL